MLRLMFRHIVLLNHPHPLRAKALADQVGAYHLSLTIDTVVEAVVALFTAAVTGGRRPRFRAHGGTNAENLALQVRGGLIRM